MRGCRELRHSYLGGAGRCSIVSKRVQERELWLLRGCRKVRHSYIGGAGIVRAYFENPINDNILNA